MGGGERSGAGKKLMVRWMMGECTRREGKGGGERERREREMGRRARVFFMRERVFEIP